ncbi:flavodoxin domain-containing protein [Desulfosporosinus nitroreducens]|uniref:flavodoxin domain-containing protein n=1 Tax=Desulfosporosinus nitroreducens TaxID=2018668 RepID=UPI00207C5AE7|nr:flavodoxin domain-containing protein [Desulfosporosinus nitroreducens]MCO1603791.1 flavodoxin [Desulfosporosinus nitroreducens]
MKTLIIYKSYHKMNTEKIAKVMAQEMNAKLAKVENVMPEDLVEYDLIGFGSGIYGSKFHKTVYEFLEKMPSMNKKAFVFFTSAEFGEKHLMKEKLSEKGCTVIGEFNCSGEYSPFGFNLNCKSKLAFIGGREKGHPDERDKERARMFANGLLNL